MGDGQDDKAAQTISGNMPVCAFIEKFHLFKSLHRNDLSYLFQNGLFRLVGAGEALMREGDPGDEMLLLMSGSVRVSTSGKHGEVELAQLGRGAVLGEVGVLTGKPRTATVTAMEDAEVIVFGKDAIEVILRKYPRVRKLLLAMVEGRVKTAIDKANA